MGLVNAQTDLLQKLVAGATPETDDDREMMEVLSNVCESGQMSFIIKREHLDRLEALQGEKEIVDNPEDPEEQVDDDPEAVDDPPLKLVEAVRALDPNNDEHWNNDGKPAMKAVEALFAKACTRADVENVAPNYDREAARAAAG